MPTTSRRFSVAGVTAAAAVAVFWALALLFTGAARADAPDGAAREAYQRGAQAYAKHQYAAAAAAFEEGFQKKPHPAFLFNLALTYRALGQPQQAISYYERYLEALPSAPDRAQVETAIAEERRKLPAASPGKAPAQEPALVASAQPAGVPVAVGTGRDEGGKSTPIYKKWWFWAAGGAVVVAAVGIGLGVGLQPGAASYREVTWQ